MQIIHINSRVCTISYIILLICSSFYTYHLQFGHITFDINAGHLHVLQMHVLHNILHSFADYFVYSLYAAYHLA